MVQTLSCVHYKNNYLFYVGYLARLLSNVNCLKLKVILYLDINRVYFGCGGDLSVTKCINDTSFCLKDYSMQQFDNIYIYFCFLYFM